MEATWDEEDYIWFATTVLEIPNEYFEPRRFNQSAVRKREEKTIYQAPRKKRAKKRRR